MPIVDVTLNHRVYPIACEAGQEERVRHVARYVQQRVKEVRGQAPSATDAHLLVMVSMILADELVDVRSRQDNGVTSVAAENEEMAAMVAALADRIETIARRLEEA